MIEGTQRTDRIHGNAGSPTAHKLLERIIGSPHHLVALETSHLEQTLERLRVLALRSGTSVYAWQPESGIVSLRESDLHVPGSKRIGDALRYVLQSMHFGIYLFADFADYLKPADTVSLRRISRSQTGNKRKLVFVGSRFDLPEELEGMYERIAADEDKPQGLRLREGRWVQ